MKKVNYVASVIVVTASCLFSQYSFADESAVLTGNDNGYVNNDSGQASADNGTVGTYCVPGWC